MLPEVLAAVLAGLRDAAIAGTAGGLVSAAVVFPDGAARDRVLGLARVSAAVWALASVGYIFAAYAVIDPAAAGRLTFGSEVWWFATSVPLGQALLQVAIAAVLTSIAVMAVRTRTQAAWTLAPVGWALVALGVTGHASGAADHHLATSALFLHLVGASVWLGGIASLAIGRPRGEEAASAVARTSRLAGWAVLLVVASGIVNGLLRVGSVSDLVATTYGLLLTAKVLLVGVALAFGAWYRARVIPTLATGVRAAFWRLLGVEMAVLLVVTALAVTLAQSQPPVPLVPIANPSPAWFLTGYDLPPAPTGATWFTLWRFEIVTALAIAIAAWVYLRWVRRLHARGDAWPWFRTAAWMTGLAVLTWTTQGGPAIYGIVSFSGHMVEHMIFVSAIPVALAFGAPVTLAFRALPSRTDGSRGAREWLRAFLESRLLRALANPIVAAVNFAGSMFVFYYTPVFNWVLHNHIGHVWMAIHFVAVGYFFANALVGIDPGPRRPSYPMRIVLLFATMAFHAFFGVALMMSESLLVPRWFGLMGRTWGADALGDQQLGGQIAWGIGEIPVFLLAIGVVAAWRRADAKVAKREDRKADRDDDAELRRYNEMLGELARQDGA